MNDKREIKLLRLSLRFKILNFLFTRNRESI